MKQLHVFRIFGTAVLLLSVYCSSMFPQLAWRQSNIYGGKVSSLASGSDGVIYAGTSFGGVYISSDNGESWDYSGLANSVLTVSALAVTPQGSIIAGISGGRGGLYRSGDKGKTWTNVASLMQVTCIAVDTTGVIFVGRSDSPSASGVWKSTDDGITWHETTGGFLDANTRFVNALAGSKSGILYAGTGNGAFRSTDGGNSWMRLNLNGGTPASSYVTALGVTESGKIYCGTQAGLFVSSDGGSTWNAVSMPSTSKVSFIGVGRGSIYVFLEAYGVVRLDDSTGSCTQALSGSSSSAIALNPRGHVFIGSYGDGPFRSTDNGLTWLNKKSGMAAGLCNFIIASGSRIFLGVEGGDLYHLDDGVNSWVGVSSEKSFLYARSIAVGGTNSLYVGTADGSTGALYRSDDNGNTFTDISFGKMVTSIAADSKGNIFTIAYPDLFRSADRGQTWKRLSATGAQSPNCVMVDAADNVLVGVPRGIFRSTDNGANWAYCWQGLIFRRDTTSVDTASVNKLFRDSAGNIYAAVALPDSNRFMRSTDKGISWKSLISFAQKNITSFTSNKKGEIFVSTQDLLGTSGAMLRSTNQGITWSDFSAGVSPGVVTISLAADTSGVLYAATKGGGVFQFGERIVSGIPFISSSLPYLFDLAQNYPNPFNPSTTIKFSVPERLHVSITIWDVNGRMVEKLVNGELDAGIHAVRWSGEKYSSGIYFYCLQAGKFLQTGKMVLVK